MNSKSLLLFLIACLAILSRSGAQFQYNYSRAFTGDGTCDLVAMQPGRSGHMYVLGNFQQHLEMAPGTSHLINADKPSIFFAGYDAGGNLLFARVLRSRAPIGLMAYAMTLDSLDNLYITGTFDSTVDFNPDPADSAILYCPGRGAVFFAKYDSSGNYCYARAIQGSSAQSICLDLKVNSAGELLLAGQLFGSSDFDPASAVATVSAKTGLNTFLAKYDTAGNYLFAKVLPGSSDNMPGQMAIGSNNAIYLTGTFYKTMDADPGPAAMMLSSADAGDVYFARYDSTGRLVWARSLGGPDTQLGQAITIGDNGDCYIAGSFSSNIDTDPGAATVRYSSLGGFDIFFARYDSSGNYRMSQALGGKSFNQPKSIIADEFGHVLLAGRSVDTLDFNLAEPGTVTAYGNIVFMAAYDSLGHCLTAQASSGRSKQAYCAGMQQDRSGAFYLSGAFDSTLQTDFSGHAPELDNKGRLAGFMSRYHFCLQPQAALQYDKGLFTYTGTWPVDSLRWDFGDGSGGTGAEISHHYSSAGTYLACVRAYACGATMDSACLPVEIPVSIADYAAESPVRIYPNPAGDFLLLEGTGEGMRYQLRDMSGRELASGPCKAGTTRLRLTQLPAACYLLYLEDKAKGYLLTHKVLKQ